jgi:hypothetical protein
MFEIERICDGLFVSRSIDELSIQMGASSLSALRPSTFNTQ